MKLLESLESRMLFATTGSFGLVDGHKNTKLKLTDSDGTTITYALSGPGTGTVTTGSDGNPDLLLADTTIASKVAITTKGGDKVTKIHKITDASAIGSITAPTVNLTGDLVLSSDSKSIQFGDVIGQLNSTFGGSTPIAMKFANITDMIMKSSAPIKSLSMTSWTDTGDTDVITAPSLGATVSKGEFDPDLLLTTTLKSLVVGGRMFSSKWNIGQSVGPVTIKGELNHSSFLVGPGFGADNKPTTSDDVWGTASIKSLTVGGDVIFTWVTANLNPVDKYYRDGTDKVGTGGTIGKVVIKGTLSADSRILAENLPATIKEAGTKLSTATDFRFHSTNPNQLS